MPLESSDFLLIQKIDGSLTKASMASIAAFTSTPYLTLSIAPASVSETAGSVTGTVTRSGSTSGALTVNLSSNDTSEATVPATVDIPNGQQSATFTITILNENLADGDQVAIISAIATGFSGGSAKVTVTDAGVAPNLIPNGEFTNGTTDWTFDQSDGSGAFAASGGSATFSCTSGTSTNILSQSIPVTPGTQYLLEMNVTAYQGAWYFALGWIDSSLKRVWDQFGSQPTPGVQGGVITPNQNSIEIHLQTNDQGQGDSAMTLDWVRLTPV